MIGRNDKFLDEINFITKRDILNNLREVGFSNIVIHGNYPFDELRDFYIQYPSGYNINRIAGKSKVLQRLMQGPQIARLLKRCDREYKLYLTAEKPHETNSPPLKPTPSEQ